jgi:hypothetical protein
MLLVCVVEDDTQNMSNEARFTMSIGRCGGRCRKGIFTTPDDRVTFTRDTMALDAPVSAIVAADVSQPAEKQ